MSYVRHPTQPEVVSVKIAAGIFIKRTRLPEAGMIVPQHAHGYDHISSITSGAARVEADGVVLGDFQAPADIVIKAHVKHLFTTLAPDTTVLCIHRLTDDGDVPDAEEHQLELEG